MAHALARNVTVVARTGETSLSAAPRKWEFDLNITPVKPLDLKRHFSQRYFHTDPARFDDGAARLAFRDSALAFLPGGAVGDRLLAAEELCDGAPAVDPERDPANWHVV